MPTIRDATYAILDSEHPDGWLRLADTYIGNYNALPKSFVLPREHATIKPIIDVYYNDLAGFVEYIKAIRDTLTGEPKRTVHELYRTISTRYVQQVRRRRADNALRAVEKALGRPLD